jgi:hypothetical protein
MVRLNQHFAWRAGALALLVLAAGGVGTWAAAGANNVAVSQSSQARAPLLPSNAPRPTASSRLLSVADCKGLDGTVYATLSGCASGLTCMTTDERGQNHTVCISEAAPLPK